RNAPTCDETAPFGAAFAAAARPRLFYVRSRSGTADHPFVALSHPRERSYIDASPPNRMSASIRSLSRSFALCLLAGRLAGQEPAGRSFTGVAVVDSAAVARQAWARAMAALRSADTTAA